MALLLGAGCGAPGIGLRGAAGSATDRAVLEGFFSSLHHDLILARTWCSQAEACAEISIWIHRYYNHFAFPGDTSWGIAAEKGEHLP